MEEWNDGKGKEKGNNGILEQWNDETVGRKKQKGWNNQTWKNGTMDEWNDG